MDFNKFEKRLPTPQTAVDIFKDRWLCDLSDAVPGVVSGKIPLFGNSDQRPTLAAHHLGHADSFKGMKILELGPLEAAHTYHLEKLGADSIVSVEANAEAFLKCLIVKELLGLKSKFHFGDLLEFMTEKLNSSPDDRFDVVFCSGVLYHMSDPLHLIELLSKTADRCFVWTHYYKEGLPNRTAKAGERAGFKATYWVHRYGDTMQSSSFMGGNQPTAAWLTREELLNAFRHFGYQTIEVVGEDGEHELGPHIGFTAKK